MMHLTKQDRLVIELMNASNWKPNIRKLSKLTKMSESGIHKFLKRYNQKKLITLQIIVQGREEQLRQKVKE